MFFKVWDTYLEPLKAIKVDNPAGPAFISTQKWHQPALSQPETKWLLLKSEVFVAVASTYILSCNLWFFKSLLLSCQALYPSSLSLYLYLLFYLIYLVEPWPQIFFFWNWILKWVQKNAVVSLMALLLSMLRCTLWDDSLMDIKLIAKLDDGNMLKKDNLKTMWVYVSVCY